MAKKYQWIGEGIEDMTLGTSYNTTTVKDVRGDTKVTNTKGDTTVSVTPVEFKPDSPFARFIDDAVEFGYELSDLDRKFLFVKMYKRTGTDYETGTPVAWRQTASVSPGDFAIGNEALQVSGTMNLQGSREHGTFDGMAFAEVDPPPSASSIFYKDGAAARSDFRIYFEYDDAEFPVN